MEINIYFKNKKTSDLLIKNNNAPKPSKLQESHVVYKFSCPKEDCTPLSTYIGMTSCQLKRKLTCHLQQGTPKGHMKSKHNQKLDRKTIEENIEIIDREHDNRRLQLLETLYINAEHPQINQQLRDFNILPSSKTIPNNQIFR